MVLSPANNPNIQEYARLLLRLHQLIAEGEGDSEQADSVRDAMDAPWYRLKEDEAKLLRGLSADLYTIGADRPAPVSELAESVHRQFSDAVGREDWSGVLELLRKDESLLPAAQVAYLRGACWAYLGQFDVAITFFREQQRLQPLEPEEEALLLTCLIQADRLDEALPRAGEIVANETDPLLVFKAAEIYSVKAGKLEGSQAEPMLRKTIETAKRCLASSQDERAHETIQWLRPRAYLHIALSYEQLGEKEEALQACEDALKYDPTNLDALMVYGFLAYEGYPGSERPSFRDKMHRRLAAVGERKLVLHADLVGLT